jgi:hypothetical protein
MAHSTATVGDAERDGEGEWPDGDELDGAEPAVFGTVECDLAKVAAGENQREIDEHNARILAASPRAWR